MKDPASLRSSTERPRFPLLPPIRQLSGVVCTCTHLSARDLLLAAGPQLEADPVNSNLILPEAIERQACGGYGWDIPSIKESQAWWEEYLMGMEKAALIKSSASSQSFQPEARDVVYVSIWTIEPGYRTLDFIIACTGSKPIFVFTTRTSTALTASFFDRRIPLLARRMKDVIPPRRVFAMVGFETVIQRLAIAWEGLTGQRVKPRPFYQATHTYCTRHTIPVQAMFDVPSHRMGLAREEHIEQAGRLCSAFTDSAHDDPYRLNIAQGIQEAAHLTRRKELYVYEAPALGAEGFEVVCIIAVTRRSRDVAAVSKVYTHKDHRRKGYAKKLLTYVCHDILRSRERVVLFVSHDLTTAARVYGRVGFVGVGDRPTHERALVERWLELGFEDVDVGHW